MDTISLARGIPAPECIPVEELADCARAAIELDGATVLSYGPVGGYQPLREWIAQRHGVDPARVLVTNGSLQGIAFLADHFAGRRVLVETPTTERRRRLVELTREHDLLVLEDDPYGLVRFDGESPPTLFELEGGERVVYSSSFSKTIAPGLRVGYFVLPQALERELEALATSTYITPVLIGQAAVFEFLRRGNFEPNLERVSALLRTRRDAMLEALERELPDARWSRPQGGYFVWLELPEGADAGALLERATAAGVTFVPGADFGGAPNTARLAFSFVSPDEIREGVRRLAALVREPLAV